MRAARPGLSLSSDFIVGFPGETDADFDATLKLVEDVGFDGAFSFLYSPRPGTPAAELADPVPRRVKQARLARLQALLDAQYRAHSAAMVGTRQRVLVTGRAVKASRRTAGPHRQQPRRQFRRRRGARSHRYVDVDDHRGAVRIRCAASSSLHEPQAEPHGRRGASERVRFPENLA